MMKEIHITRWLWCGILTMLLTACSSSDGTEEPQPTMLTIYVYPPEHPIVTRGVAPIGNEAKVNKLQIWIFESNTGELVGYLNTSETTALNESSTGATYQIAVSDEFAQYKPDVDVYVLANVTENNCGCSFDGNSTVSVLKEAKIGESYFGLSSLTTAVPAEGLPMTGMLKAQPVVGDAPALRVGTTSAIATVPLVRMVSKVRFVFANTTGSSALSITGITLDANMLPTTEYLIPRTSSTYSYNTSAAPLLSTTTDVAYNDDPTVYIYDDQEAQVYEDLIDGASVADPPLVTVVGPYYLRESDKQLSGTISYKIGEESKSGTFQMEAAGEFLRNHTWIVYAYHTGGGFLQMDALYIKDWTTKNVEHEVYNW